MSKVAPGSSRITEDDKPVPAKRMRSTAVIPLSTAKFRKVLEADSFVDKTMLIEEIFAVNDENSYLVTAPRRFGKSVNLDMLKLFLSIEIDDVGNRKTKSKLNEPIRDTETYRLFMRDIPKRPGQKLEISKEVEIMDQHLGKYPVIYVNFKTASVDSFDGAVSECKRVIRESFREHEYLCESSKLNDGDKADCKKWCLDSNYLPESCDRSRISEGFKLLSKCLFQHFDATCFVLVDEYDSISATAMLEVEDQKELKRVVKFFISCLDFVSKDNNNYVRSAFITGISYICTTGLSALGNVKSFQFLNNERFYQFYGLTIDEMKDLKGRFLLGETEYDNVLKHYNGYRCNGDKLLSIFSIMNYLSDRKLLNFWRYSGTVTNLNETLKIYNVKYELLYMLSDLENTVKIDDIGKIELHQVVELKTLLENPDIEMNNNNLIFTFLLEQGYFSVSKKEGGKIYINIPNEEIKTEFRQKLREHYSKRQNYGLNFDYVDECAPYWNNINFSNEKDILITLKEIRNILNKIFENVKLDEKNEASFHHIMFVILLATQFIIKSETLCQKYLNKGRLDLFLQFLKCFIIIELKYKKNAQNALECIIERNYCEKLKDLVVENYILLGINMNEDKSIDMCCLINKNDINDKIINIE